MSRSIARAKTGHASRLVARADGSGGATSQVGGGATWCIREGEGEECIQWRVTPDLPKRTRPHVARHVPTTHCIH
eukprot:1454369-Pleurochrysis_carterae.AAC.3